MGSTSYSPSLLRVHRVRHSFEKTRTEQRNHRHRHHKRRQQGEAKRQRQRRKKKLADAVEKCHREEVHDVDERCGQHREIDFRSADLGGDHWRGAHLQMAVDVFQRDDGVVDHARKRQRQTPENHRIDGAAHHAQNHKCGQRRERDGEKHRRRGSKTTEENQDHQAGENQTDEPS